MTTIRMTFLLFLVLACRRETPTQRRAVDAQTPAVSTQATMTSVPPAPRPATLPSIPESAGHAATAFPEATKTEMATGTGVAVLRPAERRTVKLRPAEGAPSTAPQSTGSTTAARVMFAAVTSAAVATPAVTWEPCTSKDTATTCPPLQTLPVNFWYADMAPPYDVAMKLCGITRSCCGPRWVYCKASAGKRPCNAAERGAGRAAAEACSARIGDSILQTDPVKIKVPKGGR